MTTNTQTALCLHCGKPAAGQLVCGGCGVVERPRSRLITSTSSHSLVVSPSTSRSRAALLRALAATPPRSLPRPPAGRAGASLRMTSLVNRAYRTLKDPVQRGLYWLELNGESLGRDNERVPPALAARVFEVQEQLEELRAARPAGKATTRSGRWPRSGTSCVATRSLRRPADGQFHPHRRGGWQGRGGRGPGGHQRRFSRSCTTSVPCCGTSKGSWGRCGTHRRHRSRDDNSLVAHLDDATRA